AFVTQVLDDLVSARQHREDLDDAEALGALLVHDELIALPGRARLDLLPGLGLAHVLAPEIEDARQLAVRNVDLGRALLDLERVELVGEGQHLLAEADAVDFAPPAPGQPALAPAVRARALDARRPRGLLDLGPGVVAALGVEPPLPVEVGMRSLGRR